MYSVENNMNPGPVPAELQVCSLFVVTYREDKIFLQDLSQAEEMLISRVIPIMSLYRLPHGQLGYRGHVINLPQDVTTMATTLPRLPTEINIIIVRMEGTAVHRDFRVRRSKVQDALQWLIGNNIYYRDVAISQTALDDLPLDGNIASLCACTATVSTGPTEAEIEDLQDFNPYNAQPTRTFLPGGTQHLTEREMVRQSVQQRQLSTCTADTAPPVVTWPARGTTPINEFRTEGYISSAFPSLFPTGAADYLAPRQVTVTAGNYMKHFMMFHDCRFARHPRFRYFALNSEMRWRALQCGNVYVRRHPDDARLTVEELRDMVGREGDTFSNKVLRYASSLRGTRQYWFKQRSHLIAMVDTLGLPTVFFTHSAADLQWPELANLIADDPSSSSSRNNAVKENPAIADWFFYHRIVEFIKVFYVDMLHAADYWYRFEYQHRGSPHVHGLAWLSGAPNVDEIYQDEGLSLKEDFVHYVNSLISTENPAVLPDGSNLDQAPPPTERPPYLQQALQ